MTPPTDRTPERAQHHPGCEDDACHPDCPDATPPVATRRLMNCPKCGCVFGTPPSPARSPSRASLRAQLDRSLLYHNLEHWRTCLLRARSRAGETTEAPVHIDHLTAAAMCIGNALKAMRELELALRDAGASRASQPIKGRCPTCGHETCLKCGEDHRFGADHAFEAPPEDAAGPSLPERPASQPSPSLREWQPIETAPKDADVLLLYLDGSGVPAVAHIRDEARDALSRLPAPPEAQPEQEN